jgi:hypothetical protein
MAQVFSDRRSRHLFFNSTDKGYPMTSYFCPCPRGMEAALAEELTEIAQQHSTT